MPGPALMALQGISAAAGLIAALKSIFEDHDQINEKLDEILRDLQGLRLAIVRAVADILEAIDGIRRQIDEDVALDNMTLADRALFSDLAVFQDKQSAMGNSFQASDRLLREIDIVFAGPFMYVVNIRLAVLKDFDANFFCDRRFQDEFQAYLGRLDGWIAQLNDVINRSHTVSVELVDEILGERPGPTRRIRYWQATHLRDGVVVETFEGAINDVSTATRRRVEVAAKESRRSGIDRDRQERGVVEMERTASAWREAVQTNLRLALVGQVLNRPVRAVDFNPDGVMVDGRIVPASLDLRTTLVELLTSREFRSRIEKSWEAFVNRNDGRLVRFGHRRLFDREATDQETALLRGIASTYGYAAFIATLLYGGEYEERHGRGLPGGGQPIVEGLDAGP